jgi:hypothetical protein
MTKIIRSMMSCGVQHHIQNSHGLFTFSIGIWGMKTILTDWVGNNDLTTQCNKNIFLLNESQHHVLKIKWVEQNAIYHCPIQCNKLV